MAVLASGCSSILGIGTFGLGDAGGSGSDTGGPGDGSADAMIDTIVVDVPTGCVGNSGWAVCLDSNPSPVSLSGSFSTDAAAQCAMPVPSSWTSSGQPAACIVEGSTINVSGTLTVTGSRPLVLAASDSITISKLIARAGDTADGPGAPSTSCSAFANAPGTNSASGGGGAGGSFMSKGGDGGTGANTGITGGGAANADATAPNVLRGGCAGQTGGTATMAGGAGGHAGGAVYVVAGTSIKINQLVDVSGNGAKGGVGDGGGGGGGGTGGSLVLFAPAIDANGATLMANGGGGGGGATAAQGLTGQAPNESTPTTPAPGGSSGGGSITVGAGGAGFAGATAAVTGLAGQIGTGAGGGGGASGYIRANHALAGATESPAVSVVP
jgi:hypothetical protein